MFPVSIKGVIVCDDKIPLLKNERDEWELPGGKLEITETPEACLSREVWEELGVKVRVDRIIDSWLYHIRDGVDVFIVTYLCLPEGALDWKLSHEHKELRLFHHDAVATLVMPDGYKRSIQRAYQINPPQVPY